MATARTTKSAPPPAKKPARRAPAKAKAKRLPTNVVARAHRIAKYQRGQRYAELEVAQVSTRRIHRWTR